MVSEVDTSDIVGYSEPSSPTPNPYPLSNFPQFEYPDWLRNNSAPVLALSLRGSNGYFPSMFTFINADTGDRLNIPPFLAGEYFWTEEGQYLGLISWTGAVLMLNFADGGVIRAQIDAEVLEGTMTVDRTLSPFGLAGWNAAGVMSANPTFGIIEQQLNVANVSHDTDIVLSPATRKSRYPVQDLAVSIDNMVLIVEDVETGTQSELSQLTENEIIIDTYYSPSGIWAAVIAGSDTEYHSNHPDGCLRFKIHENYLMQVFDLENGSQFGKSWEVGCAEWSPDGLKLSFIRDGQAGSELCLFFPEQNFLMCTRSMFNKKTEGYFLDGHLSYQWSPDSRFIAIRVECVCIISMPDIPVSSPYLGIIDISDGSFMEIGFSRIWDIGLWRPMR